MAHITFQSPRSGKFVSDIDIDRPLIGVYSEAFQSPRSGKFVSDFMEVEGANLAGECNGFQSPRSGKFVSDQNVILKYYVKLLYVSIP